MATQPNRTRQRDDFNRNADDPRTAFPDSQAKQKFTDQELDEIYRTQNSTNMPKDKSNKDQSGTTRKFNTSHNNVPEHSPTSCRSRENFNARSADDQTKAKETTENLEARLKELREQQRYDSPEFTYEHPNKQPKPFKDVNEIRARDREIKRLESLLSFDKYYNEQAQKTHQKDQKKGLSRDFERTRSR